MKAVRGIHCSVTSKNREFHMKIFSNSGCKIVGRSFQFFQESSLWHQTAGYQSSESVFDWLVPVCPGIPLIFQRLHSKYRTKTRDQHFQTHRNMMLQLHCSCLRNVNWKSIFGSSLERAGTFFCNFQTVLCKFLVEFRRCLWNQKWWADSREVVQ